MNDQTMNDQTPTIPTDPSATKGDSTKGDSTKATLSGLIAGVVITALGFMAFSEDPEPVTPEACVEALDTAEEAFSLAGRGFGYVTDLMDAVLEFDVDLMERTTEGFEEVADDLDPLTTQYRQDSAKCRATL